MANRIPSPTSHRPSYGLLDKPLAPQQKTGDIRTKLPPLKDANHKLSNPITINEKDDSKPVNKKSAPVHTAVVPPNVLPSTITTKMIPPSVVTTSEHNIANAVVSLPPGAASMLGQFRLFDEERAEILRQRIADRKRLDKEKAIRMEFEGTRLVDGQLVMDDDSDSELLVNDPKLADGKTLPKTVANHFPKHLLGQPVEDIDPRNREYEEVILTFQHNFEVILIIFV